MTMIAMQREIGAFLKTAQLQAFVVNNANGNSGVEQNGDSIDTHAAHASPEGVLQQYRSVLVTLAIQAGAGLLANTETAIADVTLQDAPDDGSGSPGAFADVDVAAILDPTVLGADAIPTTAALTVTGDGGGDEKGQIAFGVMTERLRRHVRVQVEVTLSDAANDEVIVYASAAMGGSRVAPTDATAL